MGFVTGERSQNTNFEHWHQIVDICEHKKIYLVQMTIALRGKYSRFDAISNFQTIIEIVKPQNLKIAVVDLNHLSSSDSQVACNMAASQGINCNYFDSEEKAKKWLVISNNKVPKTA